MKKQIADYLSQILGTTGTFSIDEDKKHLYFAFMYQGVWPEMQKALGLQDWTAECTIQRHAIKAGLKGAPEIKNVIVVASGKGGVGKSTTSVNLALSLQRLGAKVGILDADIYGPSQPLMLGLLGEHPLKEGEGAGIPPLSADGIQSMSLGYLLAEDSLPMVWRGPMASKAITQLFFDTHWAGLDYLIVDMPPGTGDIPLTLVQKFPISGAVVVTTPQDIALQDARKACRMFKKVDIPVLGIIENMSTYTCPNCQHESAIFGAEGGEALAREYDTRLLGQLPLLKEIREKTDEGKSRELFLEPSEVGKRYELIGVKMTALLSCRKKDYSMTFSQVAVE